MNVNNLYLEKLNYNLLSLNIGEENATDINPDDPIMHLIPKKPVEFK